MAKPKTTAPIEPLDDDERADLEVHEGVVRGNLGSYVEVGTALEKNRERRLYRVEHRTFGAYCTRKLAVSKSYADRLIAAAAVARAVAPTGAIPTSESQARIIAKRAALGPEQAAA